MSGYLILWPVAIVMVAAAIVDDILLRRTLDLGRPRRGPVNATGEKSGDEQDRARLFGCDGNGERILGVLQSLYPFGTRAATRPRVTPSVEPFEKVG